MFHTFNVTAPAQNGSNQRSSSAGPLSTKRQKVSRACDRCRTFRTKCGEKPCPRCVLDKVRCTTTSSSPTAKQQPKNLGSTREYQSESQPRDRFRNETSPAKSDACSSETSIANSSRAKVDHRNERPTYSAHQIARIEAFFATTCPTRRNSTCSTALDLKAAYPGPFPDLPQPTHPSESQPSCDEYLTEDQEANFLRLFWEAYHPLVQASDAPEFQSLLDLDRRETSEIGRSTRALISCMTALGIQYGHGAGLTSRILSLRHGGSNICWIGDGYYRRCRDYIIHLAEPTLLSMQCYALMSVYLMNASRFREAYSLLGVAIRLSHSVGLHEEPSERLQPKERTAQRQIWWLLFTLDIKCSQQLGKPFAVQTATITCSLPSVDELTARPGNTMNFWNNLHASTYFVHIVKLAVTTAEIGRLISTSKLYEDVANVTELEQRASLLNTAITSLQRWRHELPTELLSPRKNTGHTESMSTAESPIVLELGAPNWLHLQRFLLEVYYHNAYIMLQRPFVCFSQSSDSSPIQPSQSNGHALSSLQHAITLTIIVHGLCSSSDVLFGWSGVLPTLWNATVTIIGYVIANPLSSRSRKATQSIFKALAVFEGFSATDPFAAQSETLLKSLIPRLHGMLAEVDEKVKHTSRGRIAMGFPPQQSPDTNSTTPSDNLTDVLASSAVGGDLDQALGDALFTDDGLCTSIEAVEINTWAANQNQIEMWDSNSDGAVDAMYTKEWAVFL